MIKLIENKSKYTSFGNSYQTLYGYYPNYKCDKLNKQIKEVYFLDSKVKKNKRVFVSSKSIIDSVLLTSLFSRPKLEATILIRLRDDDEFTIWTNDKYLIQELLKYG